MVHNRDIKLQMVYLRSERVHNSAIPINASKLRHSYHLRRDGSIKASEGTQNSKHNRRPFSTFAVGCRSNICYFATEFAYSEASRPKQDR